MMFHNFSTLTFLISAFGIGFNHAFRPDYTFMASTNSYYKFYREGASWTNARASCRSEGSLLFHPESEKEAREVFSMLGAPINDHVHTGISDIEELNNYVTVDGRPISQVFNNWGTGEPNSCLDKSCRCGAVRDMKLSVYGCSAIMPYICKHYQLTAEDEVMAINDVKAIIANSSDKLSTVMERQAEAAGANQVAALDRLTSNVTTAIDRLAANQAALLEQMTTSLDRLAASQAASIDKLISNLAAVAANQTVAIQRQAFALEKLANSEDKQREEQ